MEPYEKILFELLKNNKITVIFTDFKQNFQNIFQTKCCMAVNKIKTVINDDSLDDTERFMKIEEIVCLLDDFGSDGEESDL